MKIPCGLIVILKILSGPYLAHGTTAQLSWQVQSWDRNHYHHEKQIQSSLQLKPGQNQAVVLCNDFKKK